MLKCVSCCRGVFINKPGWICLRVLLSPIWMFTGAYTQPEGDVSDGVNYTISDCSQYFLINMRYGKERTAIIFIVSVEWFKKGFHLGFIFPRRRKNFSLQKLVVVLVNCAIIVLLRKQ